MQNVDLSKTADDYARFPDELFDRLSAREIFRPGSVVLAFPRA
jgi:hypothetical protein